MDDFIKLSKALSEKIEEQRLNLVSLLCTYESYETALHEIDRSIRTLKGFSEELAFSKNVNRPFTTSVFFPINLPLYSLVLFGIAPAAFAKDVYIRPALAVFSILEEIIKCIDLSTYVKNITLCRMSRKEFLTERVSFSEVIIFNGRHENVEELIEQFPHKTFIYNGRGINPAIVGSFADVSLAVKKIIEMRVFNSGQDCAGVDVIFVNSIIYETFSILLKKELKRIPVGDYSDKSVRIGRMQRPEYIDELERFILENTNAITFPGVINRDLAIVTPFVLEQELSCCSDAFPEFFAPIFHLVKYDSDDELLDFLSSKNYSDYAMYASVFGVGHSIVKRLPNTRVLVNKNINDVEIGNEAYGGYGPKANFVYKNGCYTVQPILISQELQSLTFS